MTRKEEARRRQTLTEIERIPDETLRRDFARQALEIMRLPAAHVDVNAHPAGRFALMAFGEMEVS